MGMPWPRDCGGADAPCVCCGLFHQDFLNRPGSVGCEVVHDVYSLGRGGKLAAAEVIHCQHLAFASFDSVGSAGDRKSTRLNSSHSS